MLRTCLIWTLWLGSIMRWQGTASASVSPAPFPNKFRQRPAGPNAVQTIQRSSHGMEPLGATSGLAHSCDPDSSGVTAPRAHAVAMVRQWLWTSSSVTLCLRSPAQGAGNVCALAAALLAILVLLLFYLLATGTRPPSRGMPVIFKAPPPSHWHRDPGQPPGLRLFTACIITCLASVSGRLTVGPINVLGTMNLFLIDPTAACGGSGCGTAPASAAVPTCGVPIQNATFAVSSGKWFSASAGNLVSASYYQPVLGGGSYFSQAGNLSAAPKIGFFGVFLAFPAFPYTSPPTLVTNTGELPTNYTLAPLLGQVFFIGNGTAVGNGFQILTVRIPASATNVYFGIADACGSNQPPGCYSDNGGGFSVNVSFSDCPSMTPSPSYSASQSAAPSPTSAPSLSAPPLTIGFLPGTPCAANGSCATGMCRGGYCCSPSAVRAACTACNYGTGSCVLHGGGSPCVDRFECSTQVCLGGCCCGTGITAANCGACFCWGGQHTTALNAGLCSGQPDGGAPSLSAFTCNTSTGGPTGVLSPGAAAPPGVGVPPGVEPLLVLPAASPLNARGVDYVVAVAQVCAAYAEVGGGGMQCDMGRPIGLRGAVYYYLGTTFQMQLSAACL